MKNSELITPAQSKKLHTLLSHLGLMEQKKDVITSFTEERTSSSKQLTRNEAAVLIDRLDKEDPAKKMIRKIFAICHSMQWITPHNGDIEEKRMNQAVIDMFLKKRGVYKKNLRDYTFSQLPELVTQFESIQKHCQEQSARKAFKEEMDRMLEDVRVTWNSSEKARKS
jgi:hypothetical protein